MQENGEEGKKRTDEDGQKTERRTGARRAIKTWRFYMVAVSKELHRWQKVREERGKPKASLRIV